MAERTNVATLQRVQDETSDRSAVAIRQDIAAKRESISETVDKLGDRIHETLDWREYVAEYPRSLWDWLPGPVFWWPAPSGEIPRRKSEFSMRWPISQRT